MDSFILEKSLAPEHGRTPMIDKRVLYVNDSNNSSYNGQINFDTTVLSNSGAWIDYSQATVEIPFVISASSTVDITTTANAFMAGLKSGSHHLIDSIQVDMNNSNVVQLQSFTNFYVNYKILSEWSADDQRKWGAQTQVIPDTPDSYRYSPTGVGGYGIGVSNNLPFPPATTRSYATSAPLSDCNSGFGERLKLTAFPSGGYASLGVMTTAGQSDLVGKNYFTNDGGSAAARIYTWKMLATIRLKDVSDFFSKLPLVRGVQLRLSINYNACRVTLGTDTGLNMTQPTTTMLAGRTVPIMVSASATGAPWASTLSLGGSTVTIEANVMSTSSPASSASSLLSSCRLYAPSFLLEPSDEMRYLSLGQKVIEYEDIYGYVVNSISAGASFNQILTNGISDPQKVIVIPMLNNVAGNNAVPLALQQFQSVYDTAPATTCPLGALTQFNVLVSGRTMFQQNVNYDFDMFQNEVAVDGSITGAQVSGLCSGLISRQMWDNAYRYYVCDIARRLPEEDSIPKSVQIQGINDTSKVLDIYAYVVYRRRIKIDIASGALVK